jgi:hypothetical protein
VLASTARAAPPVDVGSDAQREREEALRGELLAVPRGEGRRPGHRSAVLAAETARLHLGKFKIRTTASGSLPTTQDLKSIIRNGMPYTAMPAWPQFSDDS